MIITMRSLPAPGVSVPVAAPDLATCSAQDLADAFARARAAVADARRAADRTLTFVSLLAR